MSILLTGATGFLGSRLLLDLLTTRQRDVIVLGRGLASTLRPRVLATLQAVAGRSIDAPAQGRLRCVSGDITQPWLGLTPAVYGRLVEQLDAIWHCAGDIALGGERERLFRTNVQGTQNVLELAALTSPSSRLVHVSTMAVAGGRESGEVAEDDLTDAYGFETHYDESKYRAEVLVREWARRTGRGAVVLRPSIVASDAPLPQGTPGHPLKVLGELIDAVAREREVDLAALRQRGEVLRLRLPVSASATFNIVPDSYATEAMLRIGHDHAHEGQDVRTFHIVHGSNTPMEMLTRAIEARYPGLRLECVGSLTAPSPEERLVAAHLPGFLSYGHTRRYSRAGALALTGALPDPAVIDMDYLTGALGFRAAGAPTP